MAPKGHVDAQRTMPALFGLLTARFEDAAAFAVDGQNPAADHRRLAGEIASLVAEAAVLIDAAELLAELTGPPGSGA